MSRRRVSSPGTVRSAWRLIVPATVACFLLSGSAFAGSSGTPDLTGNWDGTYKGAGKGTVTLSITQSGPDGTISGTAITKDLLETFNLTGDYTQNVKKPRKITGSLTFDGGNPPETVVTSLKGKCNKAGTKLKLTLTAQGEKVKVTLTPVVITVAP